MTQTAKAIRETAQVMRDNLQYAIEYSYDTVAEYQLQNMQGEFSNWEDDVQGCTIKEYIDWVNENYDFSPTDPNAEEWIYNIWHNL